MTTALTTANDGRARVPTEEDIAAARELSRRWGWVLAGGILSMLVGIAVLSIRWDVDRLALFTGIVFIVRGLTDIATSGSRPYRGAAIFSGIAGLIVGAVVLSWPGPTLFVLATLTGIWLAIWGIITVVGSLFVRGELWGLWLIAGLAAVPLGGWALGHPGATLAVIVAVVGIWALIGGLMEIFASFELRRLPDALEAMRRSAPADGRSERAEAYPRPTPTGNRQVAPRPAPAG